MCILSTFSKLKTSQKIDQTTLHSLFFLVEKLENFWIRKKNPIFLNWNTFQKMSSKLLIRNRKYWGKLLNSFQDVSKKVVLLDIQKTEASPIHCHHHHPVPTTTTTITNITIHHPNHHHHLLWTSLKNTKKAVNMISVFYTSKMNKQL